MVKFRTPFYSQSDGDYYFVIITQTTITQRSPFISLFILNFLFILASQFFPQLDHSLIYLLSFFIEFFPPVYLFIIYLFVHLCGFAFIP